jgi:hypothetical protein
MFDYIRCEVPLPDGWKLEVNYSGLQTKDFEREMVEYIITSDGWLLRERGELVGPSAKYIDCSEAMRHWPEMSPYTSEMAVIRFDGVVRFGGLEVIGYDPADKPPVTYRTADGRNVVRVGGGRPIFKAHDYRAKFSDGRLVEIVMDQN